MNISLNTFVCSHLDSEVSVIKDARQLDLKEEEVKEAAKKKAEEEAKEIEEAAAKVWHSFLDGRLTN